MKRESDQIDDDTPVYNSRIINTSIEYIRKHFPELEIWSLLDYAGIKDHELDDPGHWLSQRQIDRFQEICERKLDGRSNAREAGRYIASAEAIGPFRRYLLGLLNPSRAYLLIGKLYSSMSRGAKVTARKLGSSKVEIVCVPMPGINEKVYQCENRIGYFEAVAKFYTKNYAKVEHSSCIYKGDECCRYVISWKSPPYMIWKQIRNYSIPLCSLISLISLFFLPLSVWLFIITIFSLFIVTLSFLSKHLETEELNLSIRNEGKSAESHLIQINKNYENALLFNEIGKAMGGGTNTSEFLRQVSALLEKHLDFDRGMILLADKDSGHLFVACHYGYSQENDSESPEAVSLTNPTAFIQVLMPFYKNKSSILVSSQSEVQDIATKKLQQLMKRRGAKSLACFPIVYKEDTFGILFFENVNKQRRFTQSEKNLLTGVTSQIASGVSNVFTFDKLWESEEKFRNLSENIPDIICTLDLTGTLTWANHACEVILGYPRNEIVGKSFIGLLKEMERKKYIDIIQEIRDMGATVRGQQIQLTGKSGESRTFTSSYAPHLNSSRDVTGIICLFTDITERLELENQLQRAQKMESLGLLAGGVAHDLNNILSGIVSYPELILMDLPEDSPLRKPMKTIHESGMRAAGVVADLLTIARGVAAGKETLNLNRVVNEYLDSPEFNKLEKSNILVGFRTELNDDLLNMKGSPVHLKKVLMNLVVNAAEAIETSGTVTISTYNRYLDEPLMGYENVRRGEYTVLSVSDDGSGISHQDLERIFEPFYTTKVMGRSGTGLGLAVVWNTIQDHNGYINIKTSDKGTTFELYFPVSREEIAEKRDSIRLDEYKGQGENILVVDDEETQREIATGILTKLGYHAEAVSSGEEAIEYVRTNPVDLIVLDMVMPKGINGRETYEEIIKARPGQKAIIASGYAKTDEVGAAQKLGAGKYVKKPYTLEKIGIAVKEELGK
jgi:PAS domain S-box-containing protein